MAAQLNAATVQDTYQEDAADTQEEVVIVKAEAHREEAHAATELDATESQSTTSSSRS
jgi:hypothetical protein